MTVTSRALGASITAAAILVVGTAVGNAEEGRPLALSHAAVSAGYAVTVSGDGCDQPWATAQADRVMQMVAVGADGMWSADLQLGESQEGDPVTVNAYCGTDSENLWHYATAEVSVQSDGELGVAVDPTRLWISHPTVSAGRAVHLAGYDCVGEVTLTVGDISETKASTGGMWGFPVQIPEDTSGDLAVSATCAGTPARDYQGGSITVVADGEFGIDLIPDLGDGSPSPTPSVTLSSSPSPTLSSAPAPSPTATANGMPGLPHTGN